MKKTHLFLAVLAASFSAFATLQAKENRWHINDSHSVQWETSKGELPYNDHIEMSGLRASVVYYWSVDAEKHFAMDRHMVCGVGACFACIQKVLRAGKIFNARCCMDGPVFKAEELVW